MNLVLLPSKTYGSYFYVKNIQIVYMIVPEIKIFCTKFNSLIAGLLPRVSPLHHHNSSNSNSNPLQP